jgi:hypothetical protein
MNRFPHAVRRHRPSAPSSSFAFQATIHSVVVLSGMLRVESENETPHSGAPSSLRTLEVRAGQAVSVKRGEWVRYSTPEAEGAEYIAVCTPAFSMATVHRDPE